MNRVDHSLRLIGRNLHTMSRAYDGPSTTFKKRISEMEKMRKGRKSPKKDQFIVEVPESRSYLDTATMPMILTTVAVALLAKILMMHEDSTYQETLERKIKNAPPGQGTVRMLSPEEWDAIQKIGPGTPFEPSRPKARIRTGEPLHMEDLKDWSIDVLTDAFTRAEESVRLKSK